jgi:hypothetical protein
LLANNADGEDAAVAASTFKTKAVANPIASIEDPTFTATTAHLSGHITPGGTDPAFKVSWHFSCEPECPGLQGGEVPATEASEEVVADATNLQPNVSYEVALHATNAVGGETVTAVKSFKTTATAPVVATGTNTPDNKGGVIVRGYVNPRNSPISDCHFEYGLTTSYDHSAPCQGADEVQSISVAATDGTFTLSFGGQSTGDLLFNASAEVIQSALRGLSSIGAGAVSVNGGPGDESGSHPYRVNFEGPLAKTNVEAISAQDGSVPLVGSASVSTLQRGAPTGVELINSGDPGQPNEVAIDPTGLQAGATYHFRVVAANGVGPAAESSDGVFAVPAEEAEEACPNEARREEQHSSFLPDCRAYEMASPPDKNGGDVSPDSSRIRAAYGLAPGEPMAVQFSSHTGFADTAGGGVAIDYMAIRDAQPFTQGWSTHAITPQQNPMPLRSAAGQDPAYEGDFSPDLSTGIFRAFSPLTGEDPNVANVENLYLRNDLRSPGAGSYQLLTPCPGCSAPLANTLFQSGSEQDPRFVGASADFSHVIFESAYGLTADAPGCSSDPSALCPRRLYEWEADSIRPAAVLPDGTVPSASIGGSGMAAPNTSVFNAISADGRRVFFTDNTTNSIGNQNEGHNGNLYMRLDHASTVLLNASERTDCADHDPCSSTPEPDPAGQSPATYMSASTDGSRVFFTSPEALTDDAVPSTPGSGRQLYMYNTTKPADDPHNLTHISSDEQATDGLVADVRGLLGSSNDGHWVYFVNRGQLVADAPKVPGLDDPGYGIFLWHDGTLRYLGAFTSKLKGDQKLGTVIDANLMRPGKQSRVSPNGQHLLLAALADPVLGTAGYDHGDDYAELYLYSADTDRMVCVSCNPSGAPAIADARDVAGDGDHPGDGRGSAHSTNHLNTPMTSEGGRVFFSTAEALVPGDTNGAEDAYEYDGTTGKVSLLSSGTDSHPSFFEEATPDGKDVFIRTAAQLVGWDRDTNYDLYDVRVGGGFPEPEPVSAPCSGDNCHPGTAPPPLPASGTAAFQGPGNPQQKKHRRPHHGKCKHTKRCHKGQTRHQRNHRGGAK